MAGPTFVYLGVAEPAPAPAARADRRPSRAAASPLPARTSSRSRRPAPASCRRATSSASRVPSCAPRSRDSTRAPWRPRRSSAPTPTVALGTTHPRQAGRRRRCGAHAGAARRPHASRPDGGRGGSARPHATRRQRLAGALRAADSAERIARYVASGEPFGKAGAYAIQSAAASWIETDRRQLHRYHGIAAARDGRAARVGGRRGPALTDTGLADPMQDILINWSPQETRVAVVENGAVQELHLERSSSAVASATSTSARSRACCRACSRRSSRSASSAPRSCTSPTSSSTAARRAATTRRARSRRRRSSASSSRGRR